MIAPTDCRMFRNWPLLDGELVWHRLRLSAALSALIGLSGCAAMSVPLEQDSEREAAQLNLKLGIGYMQSGHFDVAHVKLNKALQYDPDFAEAHNALGVMYEETAEVQLAERHYAKALELKPDYALARMNYGRLLCAIERTDEGEQQFLQVVSQAEAGREVAYTGAGVCARLRGDPGKADEYFSQALKVNPYAAGTLLEAADLSIAQRRYIEARALLERYHRQAGYTPTSLQLAIRVEEALGERERRNRYQRLLQSQLADASQAQVK